jgi:hypothetical protein
MLRRSLRTVLRGSHEQRLAGMLKRPAAVCAAGTCEAQIV